MSGVDLVGLLGEAGLSVDGPSRRGATATVFPVRTPTDDRLFAVKVLDQTASPERFEREAQILSTIDHPSITPLVDFGQLSNGQPYLLTSWANGETLAERLERLGPLDTAAVRRVAVQLGDALDHLHARGVVHRDLSLANILIDEQNKITVIDLGVARSIDTATMTSTTDVIGTASFFAPELLEGDAPHPGSDQYAAAVIVYQLAAGVWPFDDADSVAGAFHHHLSSAPIPLRERVPTAPTTLEIALERALSKDPSDRFGDMSAFADAALGASEPRPVHDETRGGPRVVAAATLSLAAILALAWTITRLANDGSTEDEDQSAALAESQSNNATTSSTEGATPVTASWPAGLASELDCNLLEFPGFESNVLPPNFWGDPNDQERERLSPSAGVDQTTGVEIGRPGEFGAYGSIVAIRPGAGYVFAASVSFTERPAVAQISVEWLDADFDLIADEKVEQSLISMAPGRALVEVPPAPPGAVYAVTRLYKDASGGVLIADELVFAERSSTCDQLLGVGDG